MLAGKRLVSNAQYGDKIEEGVLHPKELKKIFNDSKTLNSDMKNYFKGEIGTIEEQT